MSGESMIVTFSMIAPTAKICSFTAYIQKLVRLKHSNCALCAVCAKHGLVLPAISPIAAHQTTGFVTTPC